MRITDPLALAWAERRLKALQMKELRQLAEEVREKQIELAPMRAEAESRRKERMRQDGPEGFVMIARD